MAKLAIYDANNKEEDPEALLAAPSSFSADRGPRKLH